MSRCANCGEPLERGEEACILCGASSAVAERPTVPAVQFAPSQHPQGVIVRGIRIPFLDLVLFMVKVTIAAVPATIIVALVWMAVFGAIAGAGR